MSTKYFQCFFIDSCGAASSLAGEYSTMFGAEQDWQVDNRAKVLSSWGSFPLAANFGKGKNLFRFIVQHHYNPKSQFLWSALSLCKTSYNVLSHTHIIVDWVELCSPVGEVQCNAEEGVFRTSQQVTYPCYSMHSFSQSLRALHYTMEPRFDKPLYNKVLGTCITNDFLQRSQNYSNLRCMEQNLDFTKSSL